MSRPELGDPNLQELFDVYLLATEVNGGMLDRITTQINSPELGELLGMTSELGQAAGRLMIRLTELRGTHPQVYNLWVLAVLASRMRRERDNEGASHSPHYS